MMMEDTVRIRPITAEDTANIVKWRNNPNVKNKFLYRALFTEEGHKNWLKTMINTGKAAQFIISADGEDIGSVYLRDIDQVSRKAEFGIFIGEDDYLGKGIGLKATQLILDWGFKSLKLHKIFLRVLATNQRAVNSYQKSGFIQEGYFKDEEYIDGVFEDIIFMARYSDDC